MKPSDVDGLYKVLSDEDVMKYIEPPFTIDGTAEFVSRYGLCDDPKVFALIYDKSKQVIGHIIFHVFSDEMLEKRYGKNKVWELGFVISKEYWNQGIAGEVSSALIDYAKVSGISALVIECDTDNTKSLHIAQKLGFVSQTTNDPSIAQFVLAIN